MTRTQHSTDTVYYKRSLIPAACVGSAVNGRYDKGISLHLCLLVVEQDEET